MTHTESMPTLTRRTRAAWWRLPFVADTWKRTAYVFLALPAGLLGVLAACLGGGRRVRDLHRRLLGRLLGVYVGAEDAHPSRSVIAFGLAALPLNLVAFLVTAYGWSLLPMNLLYPLRAGPEPLDGAWGGPSLEGAWAVHAIGSLPFAFVVPWIVLGLTALQARHARRFLDGARG